MAQQQQNITLGSPGFFGLNTEDAIVGQDQNFASIADNAVIERNGRLAARRGFDLVTDSGLSELSSNSITRIHYFEDEDGNTALFGVGNNKILEFTTTTEAYDTITDVTPASYTITSDDWTIVNFNNGCYFFQRGNEPLYYTDTLGAITKLGATIPKGNIVTSAYGRLWTTDLTGDKQTVYWSSLLDGTDFSAGTSGSIDVSEAWPRGYDEVTGLAGHNGRLIIFGRENILIYSGAQSPSTMTLEDTIVGSGAYSHQTIRNTGNDLFYLSDNGVRSLGRTVTENSLPVGTVSDNIRTDIESLLLNETPATVDSVYSPENAFYLLILRNTNAIYCFDMRKPLDGATRRVTRWTGTGWTTIHRQGTGATLWIGTTSGLGKYGGFLDNGNTYQFAYDSPVLTFGDNARLKIIKKIRPIMVGGGDTVATITWGYGYSPVFQSQTIAMEGGATAEFAVGEFGIDEYSSGPYVSDVAINANGSGPDVTVGVRVNINGEPFSLQEIAMNVLIGRLI